MNPRRLLITADDFGIGPETSRGILDLAERGLVRSTVLLVNSPYARDGVRLWRRRGCPVELGWHPCLTLDRPLLPPDRVPSLVDGEGRFHKLGSFLLRILRGRIDEDDVESELTAQYERFLELVERVPVNVNAHHHVHIFEPVARALARILDGQRPVPFVRRVVETRRTLWHVPGGRLKRAILSRFAARSTMAFPGNDELIGITDPPCVHHPEFFRCWLRASTGDAVELTCHPGHLDRTLIGRDGTMEDGQLHRRAAEFDRLNDPRFAEAMRACGFVGVSAEELVRSFVPADRELAATV